MAGYVLKCRKCGREYGGDYRLFRCLCGGVLEVVLDLSGFRGLTHEGNLGVFRYSPLLPSISRQITLGEGLTPTLRLSSGGVEILFKLEYLNPTGSFKDRGSALSISKALELGVSEVLEDSSGNTGISIAAYAGRAGVKASVYVPSDIPLGKYLLIRAFGANVIKAGSRDDASRRVLDDLTESKYYIGHTWNPYFIEGTKTIAFEVYEFLGEVDYVILPVASGTLLLGLWKGFNELLSLGLINEVPKLIAVQACGYDSLSKYLSDVVRTECSESTSLADAIRLTNAPRLPYMAEAISRSGGRLVVINDHHIISAVKELFSLGFAVEPTSAAAYAAFKLIKGELSGKVLIPLTGSGLKYVGGYDSPLYKVFMGES